MHNFRHFYYNILKLWTHEFAKCYNTVKGEFAFLAHWGCYISDDFEGTLKVAIVNILKSIHFIFVCSQHCD